MAPSVSCEVPKPTPPVSRGSLALPRKASCASYVAIANREVPVTPRPATPPLGHCDRITTRITSKSGFVPREPFGPRLSAESNSVRGGHSVDLNPLAGVPNAVAATQAISFARVGSRAHGGLAAVRKTKRSPNASFPIGDIGDPPGAYCHPGFLERRSQQGGSGCVYRNLSDPPSLRGGRGGWCLLGSS